MKGTMMPRRRLLMALGLAAFALASCGETGRSSSSSLSASEEKEETVWTFEEETYVPNLDPGKNFIDYTGLPSGPTRLVYYQGYDEINEISPYVRYEGMGSSDHPRPVYEVRIAEEVDYLAYYLPMETAEGLEAFLASEYEKGAMTLFGREEDSLVDGRYIYAASEEGMEAELRMKIYPCLQAVETGDESYRLVGLFERREMRYLYNVETAEEYGDSYVYYLIARLLLDEGGSPVESLYDLYPATDSSEVALSMARSSYSEERSCFDMNVGLRLAFAPEAEGGYLQAPGLTFYDPFYQGYTLPDIYELDDMLLIREWRYVGEVDLLESGLPEERFPTEVDNIGDALRPLFKEAWLFDVAGSSYAYFDWSKLRLSLGEARRAHRAEIQSAGSL